MPYGPSSSSSGSASFGTLAGSPTDNTALAAALAARLALAGGTMTGALAFSGTTHVGLKPVALTTTQRDALTPVAGDGPIWNSTTGRHEFRNASGWTSFVRLAGDTMTGALAVTPGTLATTGLQLAQTWNSPGTQCRGLEVAVTNTAAAATSTFFRVCGGAAGTTELLSVNGYGWLVGPAAATMVIAPASGHNMNLYSQGGGSTCAVNIPLTFGDGFNLGFGTSSGSRIGTGTNQRIGFWNATPVVQQVLPTGSTTDQVISLLQTLGLCRQS